MPIYILVLYIEIRKNCSRISANFELPPDYNHPSIKLVPAVQITSLRYKAFTPAQREILSVQAKTDQSSNSREVVAIYDDLTKTIFLPDTWKAETAARHHCCQQCRIHRSPAPESVGTKP
jgi:hypothetical protein